MNMKKIILILTLSIVGLSVLIVGGVLIGKSISKNKISNITITTAKKEIMVGSFDSSSTEIELSLMPETASLENVNVYSSDENIASVSIVEGKVFVNAVSEGTVNIIAQSKNSSSVSDSCTIVVSDIVLEKFDFVAEDKVTEINSIEIQKDGVEHYVDFNIEPFNGNLDNLGVSYDSNIIESASIDKQNKRLVIIPKTDIVQTSTTIDIELYENTNIGKISAQYVSLHVNLKARTGFLRFGFYAPYSISYVYMSNDFVYLDNIQTKTVSIQPQLSSDATYTNIYDFNPDEYEIFVYQDKIMASDAVGSVVFKDGAIEKFSITKTKDNFTIDTKPGFVENDSYLITFKHIYTETSASLNLKYLDNTGSSLKFEVEGVSIDNHLQLTTGTYQPINFSYDQAVENNLVSISYQFVNEADKDALRIVKNQNKIYVEALSDKKNVAVTFVSTYNYWDQRYNNYQRTATTTINFDIQTPIEEIYFVSGSVEVNKVQVKKNDSKIINIEVAPYNTNVDYGLVEIAEGSSLAVKTYVASFTTSDGNSTSAWFNPYLVGNNVFYEQEIIDNNIVVVGNNNDDPNSADAGSNDPKFNIYVGKNVAEGTYKIVFKLKEVQKTLYIEVVSA